MSDTIDGTALSDITIDGQSVSEVTVDGQVVWPNQTTSSPTSTVSQYDAKELTLSDTDTVSTWPDEEGTNDLSADAGAPEYQTDAIGSNPAVFYDGSNDAHANETLGPVAQPFAKSIVIYETGAGDNSRAWVSDGISGRAIVGVDRDTLDGLIWAGDSFVEGGSYSSDTAHILTGVFDGANSEVRIDGTTVATGDPGANSHEGITVGQSDDLSSNQFQGYVGEVLVYSDTSEVGDAESYLSDEWGVTI